MSMFFPAYVCRVWVNKDMSNNANVVFYLKRVTPIRLDQLESGQHSLKFICGDRRDWPDGHYTIDNPHFMKGFDLVDPDSLPWLYGFMVSEILG